MQTDHGFEFHPDNGIIQEMCRQEQIQVLVLGDRTFKFSSEFRKVKFHKEKEC